MFCNISLSVVWPISMWVGPSLGLHAPWSLSIRISYKDRPNLPLVMVLLCPQQVTKTGRTGKTGVSMFACWLIKWRTLPGCFNLLELFQLVMSTYKQVHTHTCIMKVFKVLKYMPYAGSCGDNWSCIARNLLKFSFCTWRLAMKCTDLINLPKFAAICISFCDACILAAEVWNLVCHPQHCVAHCNSC